MEDLNSLAAFFLAETQYNPFSASLREISTGSVEDTLISSSGLHIS
jgi:hypothetical protein